MVLRSSPFHSSVRGGGDTDTAPAVYTAAARRKAATTTKARGGIGFLTEPAVPLHQQSWKRERRRGRHQTGQRRRGAPVSSASDLLYEWARPEEPRSRRSGPPYAPQ